MTNRQYHIALGPGEVSRYVILPGDPGRVPAIAQYLDNARQVAANREYTTYNGEADGIPITVTSTGIGCPSAAICIEELIKIGADTFIRVGTAGSLQKEVGLGDLAITTAAVRDEGTSRQYVPLSFPAVANLEVTWALQQAAQQLGVKAHLGIGHCKDAFFSEHSQQFPLAEEHRQKWQTWQRAQVISTSMESAALFVIGSIRQVRVGEVLAIIGLTWDDAPIVDKKVGIQEAIQTAIAAIKMLHANDRT